jgi:uncharacterized phiE125 gp8 family phage protein
VTLTRITAPAAQPVTLAEAKAFAAIETTDWDALVASMIAGATAALDGEAGELGRAILEQTWRLDLDGFPACSGAIELPLPPLISVDEITYLDPAGAEQTLAPTAYRVTGAGSWGFARITPALDERWPATARLAGAVSITFTAGFGAAAEDVPEDLRIAIMARVAGAFAVRESVILAQAALRENPATADTIGRWTVPRW